MAYFTNGNAEIYYEESGQGEPVIAVHGLIENTVYWEPIVARINEGHHWVCMDMRGHGRTRVTGEPAGYDAGTMAGDIMALADHLGLARFHLLTHSTGGFAGVRHAMRDSSRLGSLILTNTGSFTSPVPGDPDKLAAYYDRFASSFENFTWDQIMAFTRVKPGPFFRGIMESERAEEYMQQVEAIVSTGDRKNIAAFVRSFYRDPDPCVDGLRQIKCPVLIVTGDKDDLFIASSRLMAAEIPGAELAIYPGIGHMSAIEAPQRLALDV